ncbi:MAG: hypothetical protein LBJ23_10635 [Tannerella sp.]|jgi:tetratricopeptide (TPR) repeat protein|nr:hypothetical protein [Tannerella sp.]
MNCERGAGLLKPRPGGALCVLSCILLLAGGIHAQDSDLQRLVYQKKFAAAVDSAAHLQAADSTDLHTMYAVGQAYEGLLRYREAYRCYLHCLTLGDDAPADLLNAAARMAANMGMQDEAETYFHRALAIDSVDFYANYQLARLYFQAGEYAKASGHYMFLAGENPDNPVLLRGLGDCFNRMNLLTPAAECYMQAFALNRENAGLASALVNTLLIMGQAPEALSVCDTALAYNPGHRLLLQNRAMALFSAREYARADSTYSLLMARGDSSYMTVKYGGFARYYADNFLDAIVPLEKAYALDTAAIDVCLYLGSALGRTYDRVRACEMFDRAEALMHPRQFTEMLTLFRADTYVRDGRFEDSYALFYELWRKTGRQDILSRIWTHFGRDIVRTEEETVRRRSLFVHMLLANEYEDSERNRRVRSYIRSQLLKFRDDLFFRGLTEYPMLAPDGRTVTLTVDALREAVSRLPESEE